MWWMKGWRKSPSDFDESCQMARQRKLGMGRYDPMLRSGGRPQKSRWMAST